jgi:hypothetical protein
MNLEQAEKAPLEEVKDYFAETLTYYLNGRYEVGDWDEFATFLEDVTVDVQSFLDIANSRSMEVQD